MQARDGPESMRLIAQESAPLVTRHETPVSRSELMPKRVKKPAGKQTKKPPKAPGFFWRKNGAGFDLRRDIYVTSHDGERKRKQPFVAHMGAETFRELKRQHKGAALERAVAQWIADRDKVESPSVSPDTDGEMPRRV